ncbi:MAG: tetratricopeptide repeat protein [Pseudomonadota bacterium]
MWLQRCISYSNVKSWFALAALALALGGCASGSGTPSPRKAASAIAEDPAAREVSPQAQTLYEQAVAIMASGDNLEAQFRFEEFVLRYPDYPGAYTNLAIIHAQNGDDAGAEGRITDALMIDPRHAPTLNQLGMLLRRQGKFVEAEAAYLRALEADSSYLLAHYNLGVLYELYLQKLDQALVHFEKYQSLIGEDKQVERWITDLRRRVERNQRTANVTE